MKKRFTFTLDEEIVKSAKKQAIDENITLSAKVNCFRMMLESIARRRTQRIRNKKN